MTVIAALRVDGDTWIASDSRALFGGTVAPGPVQKWIISADGRRAVGISGDLRTVNVLRGIMAHKAGDVHRFVGLVREALHGAMFMAKQRDGTGAPSYGQWMIYATTDGVWDIDSEFGIVKVDPQRETLWARGSGGDFALGADYALRRCTNLAPEQRLILTVEAAIANDVGCGPPIFIKKLGRP